MESFWNFPLVTVSAGDPITVRQVALALLIIAIAFVASRLLSRLVGRALKRRGADPNVVLPLERLAFWAALGVVFIVTLDILHIPLTALAFLTGAVALGLGFGAQNLISNFMSGWILLSERPVRIGDFVEVDNWRGTVERIGARSTRIRRGDGVHVLVPNSQLLEKTVLNWTLTDRYVRVAIRVGVAYGSPVREVERLLLVAASGQPDVRSDPPPQVIFEEFGDSALIFELLFWSEVAAERDMRASKSELRYRIDELFRSHGITIAYPQLDVNLAIRGAEPAVATALRPADQ